MHDSGSANRSKRPRCAPLSAVDGVSEQDGLSDELHLPELVSQANGIDPERAEDGDLSFGCCSRNRLRLWYISPGYNVTPLDCLA